MITIPISILASFALVSQDAPAAPAPLDLGVAQALSPALLLADDVKTLSLGGLAGGGAEPLGEAKCVTIQRGLYGNVADTQVGSDNRRNGIADVNYGASNVWNSGTVSGLPRLSLLRFDLSFIPPSAQILVAEVTLETRIVTSTATVNVHRIREPWDENVVTFASFGNAYYPSVETSFANGGDGYSGPLSFDIKNMAQKWVAGEWRNRGLLLEQGAASYTNYWSSEWSAPALRPKLFICYAIDD